MKKQTKQTIIYVALLVIIFSACKKTDVSTPASNQATTNNAAIAYNAELRGAPTAKATAEVPLTWYNLIITTTRFTLFQATGPTSSRLYGYVGLALYESVVPGMPMYQSLQGQLSGSPSFPQADMTKKYYYPACANAAIAGIAHAMLGNASAAQQASMDSLENVFYTSFQSSVPQEVLDRSVSFGKAIANAVYNWSKEDGGDEAYNNPFPPYTLPTGPQYWQPQPGQFALLPYWGKNRTFVPNNATSTQPLPPIPYSTNPNSEFYREEMQVYKGSINQNPDHRAAALYWNSLVGTSAAISILGDVLTNRSSNLATAAEAYCKMGMAMADAEVSNWITKFKYVQVRPITYIRANIDSTWTPLLPTPPYPDYTSGYTIVMASALTPLADMFGNNTTFTCPYINNLGQPPRVFNSFSAGVLDAARSRVYGGIHILSSCYVALPQGNLVATHVDALRFKRDMSN